jgi:hypothetical protein
MPIESCGTQARLRRLPAATAICLRWQCPGFGLHRASRCGVFISDENKDEMMTEEQELEDFLTPAQGFQADEEPVSRREFLRGGLAGGAAGLAIAAGSGVAAWKIAEQRWQTELDGAQAEIARLKGLVALYEDLENVGLDSVLKTGMAAVALPLGAIEAGAKVLEAGAVLVEDALLSLEQALPSARESILWLEDRVSALASGITTLESALGKVLERAGDLPAVEALQGFAAMVLDNLPFGLGDKIRGVFDGLAGLLTGVDDLVAGVNTQVLQPLSDKWFSADEGNGLGATLVAPLVEHVLDPLQEHLGNLASLADSWQQNLAAPGQHALEQRAKIRENIASYKRSQGLD